MKKLTLFIKKHPLISHGIFSFFTALVLAKIFFWGVKANHFLFIGDEFLVFSKKELYFHLFLRNPHDLGVPNGIPIIVNIYDRLYYFLLHTFNINFITAQPFYYLLKLFLSVFIPYLGFRKLGEVYGVKDDWKVWTISLWYSFNTYTMINWNGAFFSTLLVLYCIAPLALYFYHKAIFAPFSLRRLLLAAICIYAMSFLVYVAAVFFIFLFLYTAFLAWKQQKIVAVVKRVSIFVVLLIPLYVIFIPVIFDIMGNSAGVSGSLVSSTAGILSGGVLHQMLLWSVWPIYTYWEPRNGFTYYRYLYTPFSIIAPFLLYGVIFVAMLKKRTEYAVLFIFSLLIFLFFAKGPQFPLGEIYTFLVTHFPPFILFRSPDNKFAFGIIFVITLLLMVVANNYSRRFFLVILAVVIFIQAFPIFTGSAVRGENTPVSWDRIIFVPKEYQDIADYINKHSLGTTYVLPLPSESYGQFHLSKEKLFIGQDLLPKITESPFVHWEQYSGMPARTNEQFKEILTEEQVEKLSETPIRFIVIRKDMSDKKIDPKLLSVIKKRFLLVKQNKLFSLFENKHYTPLISSENITYTEINPIAYRIRFTDVKNERTISFLQNFNIGWEIYPLRYISENSCLNAVEHVGKVKECIREDKFFGDHNNVPLSTAPLKSKHTYGYGFANQWTISQKEITSRGPTYFQKNSDGSINFSVLLYFQPQVYFMLAVAVSFVTLAIYSIVILLLYLRERRYV